MIKPVMIVGGPRDGESVEFVGRRMLEPIPQPIRFHVEESPPLTMEFPTREYVLHRWADTWGPTKGLRYVLREMEKGLGAIQ
jgi:hypothetical protein